MTLLGKSEMQSLAYYVAVRQRRSLAGREKCLDNLEARGGIEPPIKVLQTFALPLGDRAPGTNAAEANCDFE